MYIFYDFETSSTQTIGQILSYSFICVDEGYNILQECNGFLKLNRTQLPDVDSILVTGLDVAWLNENGETEWEAAQKIHQFLNQLINTYGPCTLTGFNSNQFDLSWLRTLFIRYGLNPYFMGKLKNKDILHYVQHLAFQNKDDFPWVRVQKEDIQYYSFRLEDLTTAFQLLDQAQSHDAREDVLLTIKLAQYLAIKYQESIFNFEPIKLITDSEFQGYFELAKQKKRHFAKTDEELQYFDYDYLLKVGHQKSAFIVANLGKAERLLDKQDSLSQDDILSTLSYINLNKAFFTIEELNDNERKTYGDVSETLVNHPIIQKIYASPDSYFELIKKKWDIEYQIHDLGFQRIDQLATLRAELFANFDSHEATLKKLLERVKEDKDRYLIQLYNRLYLNYHPSPNPDYLKRYIEPRYVTGAMLKDPDSFKKPEDELQRINELLNGDDLKDYQIQPLVSLKGYYEEFINSSLATTVAQ